MSSKNMNKVFPPLSSILQFYWYYSTITVAFTWLLTPLLFYVILTQSKGLKTFKWLILNHSFWCFLFATVIGLFKPIIFLPAFAGFPLGLLRESGSFGVTGAITVFEVITSVNCVVGLAATTFSRYLLAFPSKLTNWFNYKVTYLFITIFTIFSYLVYYFQFLPTTSSTVNFIKDEAIQYDSFLATIISQEPAFFYAPRRYGNKMNLPIIAPSVVIISIAIIVMLIFVYLVTKLKKSSVTTTALQRSLIISSIMQILLTILFLFLPLTLIALIVALEIPNSTNLSCIIFCLLSTHSVFEFSATLYFVSPYRKYVSKLFTNYFGKHQYLSKIIHISAFVSISDAPGLQAQTNKVIT